MTANPVATVEYPCEACGASVVYLPGSAELVCGYCGNRQAIPAAQRDVVEHAYDRLVADRHALVADVAAHHFVCQRCGGDSESTHLSHACPFCGAPLVVDLADLAGELTPEAVLPFGIDERAAREALTRWTRSRWFAPAALKAVASAESTQGTYVPYWTFDADTVSEYTGRRGEHYTVQVSYTDSEGRSQTRAEQRTSWHAAAGTVQRFFDDVLVVASNAIPAKLVEKLTPWPLKEAVAFTPDYLAGHRTLRYDVEPEQGLKVAQAQMGKQIQADVRKDIGGHEQQITSVSTRYRDLTTKLVLLPVWLAAYVYAGRTFEVAINARTGEVIGERPYSVAKIVAAVLAALLVVGAIVAAVMYARHGGGAVPAGP